MKRTTAPGSVGGQYVNDNPSTGVIGTLLIAEDRNATQEEIIGAIEEAGLTPTDADNGQLAEAIQIRMQPGMLAPYAGAAAPAGWLACDGSAISRATYARLFAAIGTAHGVGDGSTTFNVPDLREAVPVGIGTRAAGVAAHETYTLGQFKDDQAQGHKHYTGQGDVAGVNGNPGFPAYSYGLGSSAGNPITDGTNGTPRVGTVTRGKRIGMLWCIKY